MFLWAGRMQFWQHRWKLSTEGRIFLTDGPKNKQKHLWFKKNFSSNCFQRRVACSFDHLDEKVFSQCPRMNEKQHFQKTNFPQNFPETRGMQYSQPSRKNVDKRPIIFHSMSKNEIENKFFQRNFPSNRSYGQVECSFDHQAGTLSNKSEKFSANVRR